MQEPKLPPEREPEPRPVEQDIDDYIFAYDPPPAASSR